MSDDPKDTARQILTFWFEETPPEKRFAADADLDEEIRRRFGALHGELEHYVPAGWREGKEERLAAIIVLDQFSRNLFRGDPRAYASDDAALALAKEAVTKGDLEAWDAEHGHYVLMPFMHAEDEGEVARCADLLAKHYPELDTVADHARRHREAVARFGRYPARNEALGRKTTDEEAAFLKLNPAGF